MWGVCARWRAHLVFWDPRSAAVLSRTVNSKVRVDLFVEVAELARRAVRAQHGKFTGARGHGRQRRGQEAVDPPSSSATLSATPPLRSCLRNAAENAVNHKKALTARDERSRTWGCLDCDSWRCTGVFDV